MTRPAIVLVEWHDAMSATSGWTSIADARSYAADAWGSPLSAAGFLIEDSEDYVVVAVGWNPEANDGEVTGAVMIPRSEVVRIIRLHPEQKP